MDRGRLVDVGDPDLAYPQTRGERPPDLEHALEIVAALHRLAARDPEVHEILAAVQHLLRRHDALHDPDLVERVRAEWRQRLQAPS